MRFESLLIASGLAVVFVLSAACGPRPDEKPPSEGPPPISTKTVAPEPAAPLPTEPARPPAEAAPRPAPAPAEETRPAPEAKVEEAAPPAKDPMAEIEKENALRESLDLQRGRLQAKVEEARARVVELEKRLLAVRNPFLPRPQLPAEEEKIWTTLDGAQRAARVEAQLEQARRDVVRAEADLAALPDAP